MQRGLPPAKTLLRTALPCPAPMRSLKRIVVELLLGSLRSETHRHCTPPRVAALRKVAVAPKRIVVALLLEVAALRNDRAESAARTAHELTLDWHNPNHQETHSHGTHGADYAPCTKSSALDCRQYMVLDARQSRLALRPPHCVMIFLLTFTLQTSFAHRTQGTTGWPRACRDTPRLRLWGVPASGSLHTQANLRCAAVVCVMCFAPYRSSIVAQVGLFCTPLRC